jgi:hypothetical protein
MNWYKISQIVNQTEQSQHLVGTPLINIRPFEPIIQQAVNELQSEQPGIFKNVSDINVDLGYSQFGSVSSKSPNSININMNHIKNEARKQLGHAPSNNEQDKAVLIHLIKQTLVHERSHVYDFNQETGQFEHGEMPAERAQEDWAKANPISAPLS